MGNWLRASSGSARRIAGVVAVAASGFAAVLSVSTPLYETLPPSRTGIRFVHDNARSDRRYLPESMGPGVAIFDFDNDGWMDLYFVNSGPSDFFAPKRLPAMRSIETTTMERYRCDGAPE
jgi:hypothetical protein